MNFLLSSLVLRTAFSLSVLFSLLAVSPALSNEYKDAPGSVVGPFEESRVAKLAASLGRASEALSTAEVKAIAKAMKKKKKVPSELEARWQKLLRMAQSILFLQTQERFYSVGYEFEATHKDRISWEEWKKGSKAYEELIRGTFGVNRMTVFEPEADHLYPKSRIYDEEGRVWMLTTEHVDMKVMKSGYELGTPPITKSAELEQIASFRWRLGQHKMGQSNPMTGAHQTYFPFPITEKNIDPHVAGRVAANLQLLHAQYGVAIHELMNIRRMGGAVSNLFFRPVIFDHYDLLADFMSEDPKTLTLEKVHALLFDRHIEKEVDIQVAALLREDIYDESDAKKVRSWSRADKAKFKTAWKYRDTQLKINLSGKGPILLWESRIADYVADRPEQAMLKTVIDQLLIDRAYQLAVQGKIFKMTVPRRKPGESEADYWSKLQTDPRYTPEAFLQEVGLQDQDVKRMILGKSFVAKNPKFKAGNRLSFAFEMEGWTDDIVKVILPRDPELRGQWRSMTKAQRIRALENLGYDFEGDFSFAEQRILVTEFYFDHPKYPFGHPELHLEASGNWEVKSSGSGLYTKEELEAAVRKLGRNFPAFGLHLHGFVPDAMLKNIRGKNADAYVKFLELQSFMMSVDSYAEADVNEAGPWLDSWSLDRYSPGELGQVKGHLKGQTILNSSAQKYHNIAFRPVTGGLDIEVRDIEDEISYGMAQLDLQLSFVANPRMDPALVKSKPLFSEFRENANVDKAIERYTLADALSKKYPLTSEQKRLAHLLQFEIYKPSMQNYMFFDDFGAVEETPDQLLDAAMVRTNYENNLAIPLLNYEQQSLFTPQQIALLRAERDAFIDRVYQRLIAVEKNPEYKFLRSHDNFLHLCEYLERSTHPSKPDFSRAPRESVAERQRELLENLTYEFRGEVVTYVKKTKVNEMVKGPLRQMTCPMLMKPVQSIPGRGPSSIHRRAPNEAALSF